jgi:hypothetical protein
VGVTSLPDDDRLERNLAELLGEVRVAMPGVQVLFAFLLAVPFQSRFFETTGTVDRVLYAVALASAAIATACFVAPTAFHRVVFRRGQRARLVELANRCAIAGLAWLALAIVASTTLVASVLVAGALVPVLTAIVTTGVFVVMWFGIGLAIRRSVDARPPPGTADRADHAR